MRLPDFNHTWNSGQIFISPLYENSQKSTRTDVTKVMSVFLDYKSAPKRRGWGGLGAIPTFAVITIKSQRQTFDRVGIHLEYPEYLLTDNYIRPCHVTNSVETIVYYENFRDY